MFNSFRTVIPNFGSVNTKAVCARLGFGIILPNFDGGWSELSVSEVLACTDCFHFEGVVCDVQGLPSLQ